MGVCGQNILLNFFNSIQRIRLKISLKLFSPWILAFPCSSNFTEPAQTLSNLEVAKSDIPSLSPMRQFVRCLDSMLTISCVVFSLFSFQAAMMSSTFCLFISFLPPAFFAFAVLGRAQDFIAWKACSTLANSSPRKHHFANPKIRKFLYLLSVPEDR